MRYLVLMCFLFTIGCSSNKETAAVKQECENLRMEKAIAEKKRIARSAMESEKTVERWKAETTEQIEKTRRSVRDSMDEFRREQQARSARERRSGVDTDLKMELKNARIEKMEQDKETAIRDEFGDEEVNLHVEKTKFSAWEHTQGLVLQRSSGHNRIEAYSIFLKEKNRKIVEIKRNESELQRRKKERRARLDHEIQRARDSSR